MNISSLALKIIESAGTACNVVTVKEARVAGTSQQGEVDTTKYSNLPCRFEQRPFSKNHPISQYVNIAKVSGVFYLPFKYKNSLTDVNAQEEVIIFGVKRYDILFVEVPSEASYIKCYVQKQ